MHSSVMGLGLYYSNAQHKAFPLFVPPFPMHSAKSHHQGVSGVVCRPPERWTANSFVWPALGWSLLVSAQLSFFKHLWGAAVFIYFFTAPSLWCEGLNHLFLVILWPLKRPVVCWASHQDLSTLSTNTASELDVLGHDGDTLGVDSAQVCVLKETNKIGFTGLLKSTNSSTLEPEVSLEVLSDLTNKTLEGQLSDEKLSGLLVSPDLTESNSSWPVSVGLLDSSGWRSGLPGSLGGKLLPGSFSSGRLSSGLLGTSHVDEVLKFLWLERNWLQDALLA